MSKKVYIGRSEAQGNAERLAARSSTHAGEHVASWAFTQDRVATRPQSKRMMLRWAQREARLDGPLRMHGRGTADDGAPKMTGEAMAFLGMTGDGPTDWLDVACQKDEDGNYVAPTRAAIARIARSRPLTGALLARLVVEFCDEAALVAPLAHSEFGYAIVFDALNRLYDTWTVRPHARPRPREVLAA